MSFEFFQQQNLSRKEALDDKWYKQFEQIASFQDYEYLEGNKNFRDEQKIKFLSGEIENPTLDYPKLEDFPFTEKEEALLKLKKQVLENETDALIKQIYRWRINEKIAELRMLKSSKTHATNRFLRYSKFIYGEPSPEIYQYTLSQVKKLVDEKLFSPNQTVSAAAQRLNKELFETLITNETELNIKAFDIPKIKSTKEDREYDSLEIKGIFDKFLRDNFIDDWQVVLDSSGSSTALRVSQEKKQVFVPETKKLKETALYALLRHELGTHVLRREKGERSKLSLLGLGLDRSTKGEEGVATYEEQKIKGASAFSGFDGHFAVALALGKDGTKRNFKGVFNVLRDYYFIKSKKNISEAWESANDFAWLHTVRTFRGTDCKTPGTCFTKDIVYREGNIGVWNVVKNNPDEIKRFSVGKYDPSNPRHIWILDQLGITDTDLDMLDKQSEK